MDATTAQAKVTNRSFNFPERLLPLSSPKSLFPAVVKEICFKELFSVGILGWLPLDYDKVVLFQLDN